MGRHKSMNFTLQVINETLRLSNAMPGLFRKAVKDIPVNGYTIPVGSTILLVTHALHLTSNTFKDHLEFNPWRWKDIRLSLEQKVIKRMNFGVILIEGCS